MWSHRAASRARPPPNNMKKREFITVAAIFAGLAVLAVGLYLVARPPARDESITTVLPGAVAASLEGTTYITSSKDGKVQWKMECDGLVYYDNLEVVTVKKPKARVMLEDGGIMHIRGRLGRYFSKTEDIELAKRVSVTMVKDDARQWVMHGDTASYRKEADAFYISSLDGLVNLEGGDTVHIKGARGRFDITPRLMHVEKDVETRMRGEMTMKTRSLDFDSEKNLAMTDDPVRIEGEGYELEGVGMRADMKTEKVEILDQVWLRLDRSGESAEP